jgi:hypothetical protein
MSFGQKNMDKRLKIKKSVHASIATWLRRALVWSSWQKLLAAKGPIRAIPDQKTQFAALQHDRLMKSVKPLKFIQIWLI